MSRNDQKQGSHERRQRKGRSVPQGAAKELHPRVNMKIENLTVEGEHLVIRVDTGGKEAQEAITSFVDTYTKKKSLKDVRVVFQESKSRFELVSMGKGDRKVRDARLAPSGNRIAKKLYPQTPRPEVRKPTAFETAMSNARSRGSLRVADILAGDDMLTGEQFGKRLNLTRQAIDTRRKNGQLIGLQGPSRGVRYPDWQIKPDGHLTPGIEEVLELVDGDAWAAYRSLVEDFPDASGDRLVDKLQNGEVDLVLTHIETVLRGDYT